LSHLLDHPPEEGGRNNWLAQVAGHYAAHIPHQDAYEAMVRQAAAPLGLEDAEVDKLIRSIWQSERSKVGKAIPVDADPTEGGDWRIAQPEEESGWLVSGDTRILVQIRERDAEGNASLALSAWASADFRAIAVVVEEDEVAFDVEIRRSDGTVSEAVLPAAAFGSPVALNTWLANHGVVLYTPDTMHPSKMNAGSRLAAYLRAHSRLERRAFRVRHSGGGAQGRRVPPVRRAPTAPVAEVASSVPLRARGRGVRGPHDLEHTDDLPRRTGLCGIRLVVGGVPAEAADHGDLLAVPGHGSAGAF
jgi:hypothetical protein